MREQSVNADTSKRPQLLCVGGGKGGTGKSVLSINLANVLAKEGMRVVLVDLDLGGANLHIMTGLRRPSSTLGDFFGGRVSDLNELLVPLDALQFSLLPGGEDLLGAIQPGFQRKQKLLRHLYKLDAEVVVCDLGGNSSFDTLDIFNHADCGLVVVTPEPPAIQNAYGFMKASLFRKMWRLCEPHSGMRRLLDRIWNPADETMIGSIADLRELANREDEDGAELIDQAIRSSHWDLVVNQGGAEDAQRVFKALNGVTRKFLDISLVFMGHVQRDEGLPSALSSGQVPLLGRTIFADRIWEQLTERLEPIMAVGLNEEIRYEDEVFHVQTEDLGEYAGAYHALVFSGGTILFSKKVSYGSELLDKAASTLKQDRVRFLHRMVVRGILGGKIKLKRVVAPVVEQQVQLQSG